MALTSSGRKTTNTSIKCTAGVLAMGAMEKTARIGCRRAETSRASLSRRCWSEDLKEAREKSAGNWRGGNNLCKGPETGLCLMVSSRNQGLSEQGGEWEELRAGMGQSVQGCVGPREDLGFCSE